LLTIEELLNGAQVKMPATHGTLKKANRVKKADAKQAGLGLQRDEKEMVHGKMGILQNYLENGNSSR